MWVACYQTYNASQTKPALGRTEKCGVGSQRSTKLAVSDIPQGETGNRTESGDLLEGLSLLRKSR